MLLCWLKESDSNMCNNKKDLISLDKVHIPRWNELPNVDLYLDQVVTFINSSLESFTL